LKNLCQWFPEKEKRGLQRNSEQLDLAMGPRVDTSEQRQHDQYGVHLQRFQLN
jgi:hypothetical protein